MCVCTRTDLPPANGVCVCVFVYQNYFMDSSGERILFVCTCVCVCV